jgi:hypothetical protein
MTRSEPTDELVRCPKCSTSTRSRYHVASHCPRPLASVYGYHTKQIDGMEKDLLAGVPADKAVKEWTW